MPMSVDCQPSRAETIREGLQPARLVQFLALGIPGALSLAIEAGAWEVMVAIAAILGGPLQADLPVALLFFADAPPAHHKLYVHHCKPIFLVMFACE